MFSNQETKWQSIRAAVPRFASAASAASEPDANGVSHLLVTAGGELDIDEAERLGLVPKGTAEEQTIEAVRRAYAAARAAAA